MKLIYGVKDRPKFGQLIIFAVQQLLAIMAATLVVPIIIGNDMSSVAALFGAGAGTLVYVLFTKAKSPVFLGSSFAFLGSMAAAFAGGVSMALGYLGLIIGAVFAGLVYVIIALIVKFAGVGWINKLMPAVVIGPTVAIIGLSLAGNAVGDLQKTNYVVSHDPAEYQVLKTSTSGLEYDSKGDFYVSVGGISSWSDPDPSDNDYIVVDKEYDIKGSIPGDAVHSEIAVGFNEDGSLNLTSTPGSTHIAILCGLVTLFVTIFCATFGKKFARLIPFIIGICSGYALALIFYVIGSVTNDPSLMIMNLTPFTNLVADGVTLNTFFAVPEFTFLTALGGFKELNGAYIGTIAMAYVPVAFVVFAEHIADHKNISSIIETDLLEEPGLHRTLLGDGVGSMVGALFGGCPNTTYGESVGCVAITGNASVATIITAAVMAIAISFINPFVAFVNSIPSCVMSGVCVALYGFIAVSGLRMFKNVDLDNNRNLFVVSTILVTGIGGLALTFGKITITAIATALILGILVNLMLSRKDKEQAE